MRLIHLALSQPPSRCFRYELTNDWFSSVALYSHETLATIPTIIVDEPAEMYYTSGKKEWNVKEDFPCIAPPFPDTFVEWRCPPRLVLADGEHTADEVPWTHLGIHFKTWELNAEGRGTLDDVIRRGVMCAADEVGKPHMGDQVAKMRADLLKGRWCSVAIPWVATKQNGRQGRTFVAPWVNVFAIEGDGKIIAAGSMADARTPQAVGDRVAEMHVALFALTLMNCKNVKLIDTGPEHEKTAKWHRRSRVPHVTLKTLALSSMREALRTEGRADEVGLRKAFHLVRGHYAEFRDEDGKRLFGKYAGRFWINMHKRGDADVGLVLKDYRLKKVSA